VSRARVYSREAEADVDPLLARLGLAAPVQHAPRWWRDYESECLDWWHDYARHESTTSAALVAFLSARFGAMHDPSLPLCAVLPLGTFKPRR